MEISNLFETYTNTSKSLSRNPLGIIALFIVLVYGIAALVFGLSGAQLSEPQKWPLIWFLVLFPVLVLLLFGWLVSSHHTKLYSPNDFPNEDGFFQALSPEARSKKLEREAKELVLSKTNKDSPSNNKASGSNIDAENILLSDARSSYIIAEDLVFRELEEELEQPIQRNVGVFGRDFGFDGVVIRGRRFTAIEIKMTRLSKWRDSIIRKAFGNLSKLAEEFPKHTDFILAIVTDGVSTEDSKRELQECQHRIQELPVNIQLKHYDFEALKNKYGLLAQKA